MTLVRVALLGLAALACAEAPGSSGGRAVNEPVGVALEPIRSSRPVPYSQFPALTLAGEDRVCLLDSYRVQVLCGDPGWREVRVVAREGRGPGEIGPTATLLSAPGGALAIEDGTNQRVSLLGVDGELVGTTAVPPLSVASEVTEDSLYAGLGQPYPSVAPEARLRWVDARSGRVVDERLLRFDPGWVGADTAIIDGGVVAPDGRILVRVGARGEAQLAWYSAEGEFLGVLDFPALGTVYPTARDIEQHIEDYRLIFRRPPPEEEVRAYAERPLGRFRRSSVLRTVQVDRGGRAWVLATRHSERGSYLELFGGVEHLGAIELAGRVLAFQIRDSLLVALVEALEPNVEGLYPRRLDWYRIVDVEPEPGEAE